MRLSCFVIRALCFVGDGPHRFLSEFDQPDLFSVVFSFAALHLSVVVGSIFVFGPPCVALCSCSIVPSRVAIGIRQDRYSMRLSRFVICTSCVVDDGSHSCLLELHQSDYLSVVCLFLQRCIYQLS